MKVGNKIIGLAIGQKSILIAEVAARGEHHVVHRVAEFVFPEGLSMSTPDKTGAALRGFMRSNQFSTKDVIFGLPAKRMVTRRKDVPPTTADLAASTLRVQAEGEFSSELDNLIMDFAGTTSEKEPTTVLLIATNKVLVDECEALARAAGLKDHAITSTTVALGRATSRLPGGDGLVLSLGPNGAELVVQHGLDPAHLKHLNVLAETDSLPALAAEIRRTMAAIPQNGSPLKMALWNLTGVVNPENVLQQRLSMPVTTPAVSNLVTTEVGEVQKYAPAIALALSALETAALPVDFLHSRLAAPKEPSLSMEKKLGIAAGILLAGFVAFAYIDMNNQTDKLAELRNIQRENKNEVDDANAEIQRYDTAQAWLRLDKEKTTVGSPIRAALFDQMMLDLTNLFMQGTNSAGGNTIWATDVACKVSDPYTWEVKGKSVNQVYPDNVLRAMRNSARFSDSKLAIAMESKAASRTDQGPALYNFVLSFTYQGVGYKPPATSPAARGAAPKPSSDL